MPTVLKLQGYRFFFFSGEGNEPPHVHVEYGDKVAKYWLGPVELAQSERISEPRAETIACLGHRTPEDILGEVA